MRSRGGFAQPAAFWLGSLACTAGVLLHLPMYFGTRDMGYRMAGMRPDAPAVNSDYVVRNAALIGLPLTFVVVPLLVGTLPLAWAGPETRSRRLEEIVRQEFALSAE